MHKLIANLVKDRNYGMPYLPQGVYADLRRLSMFRDQLTEDRVRDMNRLHRELKIYVPEYQEAFGKLDGAFTLAGLVTIHKQEKQEPQLAGVFTVGLRPRQGA